MKECPVCKILKDESLFYKNNTASDGLQKKCKDCQSIYYKNYYILNAEEVKKRTAPCRERIKEENQQFIINYLSTHPCVDCGEDDIVVLEFDHILGSKEYNISDMIRLQKSIDSIKEELSKCVVRCANCHKRKTAKDFNWYKSNVNITTNN